MSALAVLALGSLHRHDIPLWLARGLRSNVVAKERFSHSWQAVEDTDMIPRIMNRYFGVDVATKKCELFLIEGVPAASILYDAEDKRGKPVITQFHANKGMLLLFDAGPAMRKSLYERHGKLDTSNIDNLDALLTT